MRNGPGKIALLAEAPTRPLAERGDVDRLQRALPGPAEETVAVEELERLLKDLPEDLHDAAYCNSIHADPSGESSASVESRSSNPSSVSES
jgi:hypothetical protein